MCRSCGRRHNSVVADTSPSGPQHDGSLDSISSTGYIAHGWRSGVSSGDGCVVGVPGSSGNSGGRSSGLTMKEYDQHLSRLNKENFALKLRVYFLEEKQGQAGHAAPQLYKANIELKVENESLKRQVFDKQQLLSQASAALNQLDEEYKEQISDLLRRHEAAVRNLQGTVRQLQQSVEQYSSRCRDLEAALRCQQPLSGPSTLSQLCDIAFSTTDPSAVPAASNGGGTGENSSATADLGWTGPLSGASTGAAQWGGSSSPTAALWGFDGPAAPSLGSAGAAPASAEEESELQRKMSTDSQGSTGSCPAAAASVTATNPVNINTTNVTNNNINNTLPNTSNNLQQMQCQQQPPHAGASYQHFHHYHQQQQQQQPDSNSCSTGGRVAQSSNTGAGATAAPFSLPATLEGPQQHHAGAGKVDQVAAAAAAPAVLSPASLQGAAGSTSAACLAAERTRVHELEEEVTGLEHRLWQLEEQLGHKDQLTAALQEDLDNLRKELQEKESEVLEREEKVESLSQELETRHRQLQCKDDTISTLHTDLNRVEPEISVKVQEIVERDRIIEEKIEQIEQQNKILVEIQITLDEKQKQIAELEANLDAARQRVTQLERDYDKSCQAINGFIGDVSQRDKEIATLKKDAKKRDRKIKDLVAELKETLDMLGKAKWEAETAGGCGQDSVKEMVEEENERLWAEMEQKKMQVQSLKAELSEAAVDIKRLSGELSECLGTLQRRDEAEQQQRTELEALRAQTEKREALAKQHDLEMEGLKEELSRLQAELNDKRQELQTLRDSASVSVGSICDCVKSADKEGRQQNVEQLLRELSVCKADRVREVELLRGQLELKNSDILHLQSQLIGEAMHAGAEAKAAAAAVAATPDSSCVATHVAPAGSRAIEVATAARYEPMQVSITAKLLGSSYPAVTVGGSDEEKCKEFNKNLPLSALSLSSSSAEPGGADNKEDHLNSRGVPGNSEVSVIVKFQKQIENLRNELRGTKSFIGNQKAELGKRSYQEIVRKYRSECNNLRKNLKESNHACDLLRSRLEELAEFLEQIIYMDEQGLIDLSKLSGFNKASLHKSLNESRALSQTLSQSILAGMDTLMEESFYSEQERDMEMLDGLQSVLLDDSLYCNGTGDLLQTTAGGNRTCVSSVLCESWLPDNTDVTMNETGGRLLASNLYAEIDGKAKKLDDILVQVALLSTDLCRRESESDQANLVASLKKKLAEKEEELITLQKSQQPPDIVCVTSQLQQPGCETSQWLEVACQTLLAMAPRQSVMSYLSSSSDTQSIPSMDPLIEEALASFNDSEPCVKNLETTLVDAMEQEVICENSTDRPEHNTNTEKFLASLPGRCVVSADNAIDPAAFAKPQLAAGCVSACDVPAAPHHIPASPSESEAWSEPDRNVSLARIGLETCTLAASLDRSLSRSRQTRASAALSSESDTEECQVMVDDNVTSLLNAGNANAVALVAGGIKAMPKRKSEASEVRRLAAKLRTMEHLNETLKAELNIYQSLSYQLSPTTDQQQSDHKPSLVSGSKSGSLYTSAPFNQLGITDPYSTSSSAALTTSGLTATTSRVACPSLPLTTPASSLSSATTKKPRRLPMTVDGSEGLALAAPLLQEIRSLRSKLEESISNNDQLRDQLEAAVLSCSRASAADDQQPSHLTHLTAALLNAQETLQLTREKLSFAQRCEQVQADRCTAAERRTDEEAKLCLELRAQLKDAHTQAAAATAHIEVAQMKWMKQLEEMKESKVVVEHKLQEQVDELSSSKQAQEGKFRVEVEELKAKYNAMEEKLKEARRDHEASEASLQARLSEVTRAYEESEARMSEQHAAISEVYASLHAAPQWPHLSHLHSVLQASETQVLRVTRDRLVLLGEKSKLQAQLMSVQAQTSLLQDSLCDDDSEEQHEQTMPGLHQQLAKVQVAVKRMQDQCSRLQAANRVLGKEKEHLEEKVAGYKAVEKLVNKSDITLESVSSTATPHESSRVSSIALQQLQRQHALLQDDYTHLQRLYTLLQEDEQRACQKLQATSISLQRAQLNIEALSKQYQDKVQQLQREWQSKMAGAEQQVKETQARCQQTVKALEEKVLEVHGITQEQVDAMRADAEAQVKQLQAHVEQLQKQTQLLRGQLDGEKKVCVALRAELQEATTVLKQRTAAITSSGAAWSDDKENFLHHSRSNPRPTATASPHKSTGSTLSSKCTQPAPVKSAEARLSTGTSPLNSFNQSCGGRNTRHASHSGSSHQVKSPGRHHLVSEQSVCTYATEDELEHDLSQSVDGLRRGCDSPDLGLGSSDNGHMSSLERVMLSTRGKSGTHHSSPRKATQGLSSLPYQHQQHIAVVISERSSLPAGPSVAVDQLCTVPSHASLSHSNTQLRAEVQRLQQDACGSTAHLAEIQRQLTAANERKQTVERAICRQLTKTRQVLQKAKGNLQQQQRDGKEGAGGGDRHSSLV